MQTERHSPTILGLFVGTPAALPADGRASAIFKQAVADRLMLTSAGLSGDAQADLRVHGGPERALCHYPADHHSHWQTEFPEAAPRFAVGAFGENIATLNLTEADVAIGDTFRIGSALVQVSQPRFPCWKLGHRLGLADLPARVVATGRAGWLYRVLEPGEIGPGDPVELIAREPMPVSLAHVWQVHRKPRADLEALAHLAQLESLAEPWRKRFAKRLASLDKNR